MRVRYTQAARNDLKLIGDYLQEQAPKAAKRVAATIRSRIAQLGRHPRLGRPIGEPGIRSLSINRYPYTVYYRLEDDAVSIVHIRHQARSPWLGAG